MCAYVCVCVCPCIYILLIPPSVNEYLGCFHVLAIVNSAPVNIGVHVFFPVIILSGYRHRSGISGS